MLNTSYHQKAKLEMTTKKVKAIKRRDKLKLPNSQHRKLTSIYNKGIDRKNVLSSGRPLPSSYGHQILAQHCELATAYLKTCILDRSRREDKLKQKKTNLMDSHKRDASRIEEVPDLYLIDQKLKILRQKELAAKETLDALQKHYKNCTGKPWTPRPDVNKPLEFDK